MAVLNADRCLKITQGYFTLPLSPNCSVLFLAQVEKKKNAFQFIHVCFFVFLFSESDEEEPVQWVFPPVSPLPPVCLGGMGRGGGGRSAEQLLDYIFLGWSLFFFFLFTAVVSLKKKKEKKFWISAKGNIARKKESK